MIGQIIKKQALVLIRNPVQLLLLVGLPIILILILGVALSSFMNGESPTIQVKLGIVEQEQEDVQLERFSEDKKGELPPAVLNQLDNMLPIQRLKENVFGSDEATKYITLEEISPSDKEKVLDDNTYTALIEVPDNFTYEILEYSLLAEEKQPSLQLFTNTEHQLGVSIVDGILTQYQEQLTLQTFLQEEAINPENLEENLQNVTGDVMTLDQQVPISSKDYYTVGMAVMNVLFIASAIGSIAFLEKNIFVFDRIILANVSRWVYFIGILLSGMLFAFLHLLIIFGFSWVVFDVTWPDLLGFTFVTMSYAVAVGGIAVLLTALSYRLHSEVITNFFSNILVSLMALLGGSFFPLGDSSAFIATLGNLTPNGAGMSAYISLLRGNELSDVTDHLAFLLLFGFISIVIAAWSFPKRGAAL
ncbi:ABC transporter permease [Oceanobacillus picturae]|uniref:ABC transporter permease n=1 Tax=Oceanobacillus picturae TaxID=171693 RepID=UPI000E67CDC5|nr:ABC transporter permease [Oceanobacillus picturae]RIU89403.1 ABC transporter permease [Oceanobacillus picturae]